MPTRVRSHGPTENWLLVTLPAKDYEDLSPYLKPVQLTAGQTVYDSHSSISHCYFLQGTLISLMSCTEQGNSVAVAMVGNEGLIGAAALLEENLLPYRTKPLPNLLVGIAS